MSAEETAIWLRNTGGSSTLDMLQRPHEDWNALHDSVRHEMTRLVLHEEEKRRQRLEQPFELGPRPRPSRHLVNHGTPVERRLKAGRMLRLSSTLEHEDLYMDPITKIALAPSDQDSERDPGCCVDPKQLRRVKTSKPQNCTASAGQQAIKKTCNNTETPSCKSTTSKRSNSILSDGCSDISSQSSPASTAAAAFVGDQDPVAFQLYQRQHQLQAQLLHVTRKLRRKYAKALFPKAANDLPPSAKVKYLAERWQKACEDPTNTSGQAPTDTDKYKMYMDARYMTQCQMDFQQQPLEPKEGVYGHHRRHSVHTKYGDALVKCRRGLRGNF